MEDIVEAAKRLPPPRSEVIPGLPVDDDWQLVRSYDAAHEDGRPAKVFVRRHPARFWRLVSGDVEITTGSGDEPGRLLDAVARAIANGMLGFSTRGGSSIGGAGAS
jgi:hypothetical protein